MAMTNAEKQAAWRERQAAKVRRVAELEAEVKRLKARIAELENPPRPEPWKPPMQRAEEALAAAKAAVVAAHPDKGGTHEAATKAGAAFAKAKQDLERLQRQERAEAERLAKQFAKRSEKAKSAWARRKARGGVVA